MCVRKGSAQQTQGQQCEGTPPPHTQYEEY